MQDAAVGRAAGRSKGRCAKCSDGADRRGSHCVLSRRAPCWHLAGSNGVRVGRAQAVESEQLWQKGCGRVARGPGLCVDKLTSIGADLQLVISIQFGLEYGAQRVVALLLVRIGLIAVAHRTGEWVLFDSAHVRAVQRQCGVTAEHCDGMQLDPFRVDRVMSRGIFIEGSKPAVPFSTDRQGRSRWTYFLGNPGEELAYLIRPRPNPYKGALCVLRMYRDDVDHRHHRVRAVGCGIRPSRHFDARDVLHGDGQHAPVDDCQARLVDRNAIDQHVEASRVIHVRAMVVDRVDRARNLCDFHAWNQAQRIGDVPDAVQMQVFTGEHCDSAGDVLERLAHA